MNQTTSHIVSRRCIQAHFSKIYRLIGFAYCFYSIISNDSQVYRQISFFSWVKYEFIWLIRQRLVAVAQKILVSYFHLVWKKNPTQTFLRCPNFIFLNTQSNKFNNFFTKRFFLYSPAVELSSLGSSSKSKYSDEFQVKTFMHGIVLNVLIYNASIS